MAAKQKPQNKSNIVKSNENNTFPSLITRLNSLIANSEMDMYSLFSQAAGNMANMPSIQNARVKGISSLPCDYTKEQIGKFLQLPYASEQPLRQTSEALTYTVYPYYKITKFYADILTYRNYIAPQYITQEEATSKEYAREYKLLDKMIKILRPEEGCHRIVGQAMRQGKVFYQLRYSVNKTHNTVNHIFLQQLPSDWCKIIGYNNVSKYTVSFNLMYFLTPGTDPAQYGNLFVKLMADFPEVFDKAQKEVKSKEFVYASRISTSHYKRNDLYGTPDVFMQNGRWFYWVSLPIDNVWTFEIDDVTPAVVPPLDGLMLTYAQQADFEAAQLSLILNPLIKIFTGEIPYFNDDGTTKNDNYKLSPAGRKLFEKYFSDLMAANNTGGTAFYTAPVTNIKSHDFSESANANEISSSFNRYAGSKAGLNALIPVTDDIKAAQVESSRMLEGRYPECVYRTFEKMINNLFTKLNLRYDWQFKMFGTIFNEREIRDNAKSLLDIGDTSALYVLAALDGQSLLDKTAMVESVNASGIMNKFTIPQTAYTQSSKSSAGRPSKSVEDVIKGESGESTEDAIDAYGSKD